VAGDELAFRSATELASAIAKKDVSSRELLDLYLARVDHLDEAVHAVVTLDADRARDQATKADDETARGERSYSSNGEYSKKRGGTLHGNSSMLAFLCEGAAPNCLHHDCGRPAQRRRDIRRDA